MWWCEYRLHPSSSNHHTATRCVRVSDGGEPYAEEYVNPGLVKVNGTTFLEHLFIMLRKCERLHLPRDLFIVSNDAVRVAVDEWCGENDVAFPTENVVYNGGGRSHFTVHATKVFSLPLRALDRGNTRCF